MLVLFVLSAPVLNVNGPDTLQTDVRHRLQAPSSSHLFGTDQFGRDVLARTLHGGKISLTLAAAVTFSSVMIGLLWGGLAGMAGGAIDQAMMRVVDLLLSFPLIFLLATCIAFLGNHFIWLIVVLALTGWMDIARLVRAQVHSLKTRPFVLRARATGLSQWRIFSKYLSPAVFATVMAAAVLRAADIILVESALSFLGLGVQPPTATWGTILQDGRTYLASAWWLLLFPGGAIWVTTFGLYLLGESGSREGR